MFTVIGGLVLRPKGLFLRDVTEEYQAVLMEENALSYQLDRSTRPHARPMVRSTRGDPLHLDTKALLHQYYTVKEKRIKLGMLTFVLLFIPIYFINKCKYFLYHHYVPNYLIYKQHIM